MSKGLATCSVLLILTACTSRAERQAEITYCIGHIPDRMFETNSRSDYEGVITDCLSGRFNWKLTAISGSEDVQQSLDALVRLVNREKAERKAKADSLQREEATRASEQAAHAAKMRDALARARFDSLTKWWQCEVAHVRMNTAGDMVWENLTTDCYHLYPSNGDSIFFRYINSQTFSDPEKIAYLQRQSRKVPHR